MTLPGAPGKAWPCKLIAPAVPLPDKFSEVINEAVFSECCRVGAAGGTVAMPGCCTWLFAGGMPFPACCGNVEVGIPLAPTSAFSVAPVSFPGHRRPQALSLGALLELKSSPTSPPLERFTPVFSLMTVLGICDEGVLVESYMCTEVGKWQQTQ